MENQICISEGENNNSTILSYNNFPVFSGYNKGLVNIEWVNDAYLPVSLFDNSSLSALESVTKYIKEEIGLNYREIGLILNRNERTVWGAYSSSKRKNKPRFNLHHSNFHVPISIFKDRSLGMLEALTEYLKDTLNLRYCQIASLLNRDDRTIWTVHNRAKRKRIKENYKIEDEKRKKKD